jgi:hypothetical protein
MREPEKVKPVKVENKRSLDMGFFKTTGIVLGFGVLIGGTVWATELYRDTTVRGIEPTEDQIQKDRAKAAQGLMLFNEAEERDLDRIRKFCFGWPWEKDAPTCRVWLKHYRSLEKYSDGDLFNEETTTNAYNAMNKPDNDLGNAKSPTE